MGQTKVCPILFGKDRSILYLWLNKNKKSMKLTINCKDFKRIESISSYNHNHYQYIGKKANYPTEILEICHEDYNFYEYHLIKDNMQIFLGCADYGINMGEDRTVEIDFQYYYT